MEVGHRILPGACIFAVVACVRLPSFCILWPIHTQWNSCKRSIKGAAVNLRMGGERLPPVDQNRDACDWSPASGGCRPSAPIALIVGVVLPQRAAGGPREDWAFLLLAACAGIGLYLPTRGARSSNMRIYWSCDGIGHAKHARRDPRGMTGHISRVRFSVASTGIFCETDMRSFVTPTLYPKHFPGCTWWIGNILDKTN